jgi:uncharacterized protein YqkB
MKTLIFVCCLLLSGCDYKYGTKLIKVEDGREAQIATYLGPVYVNGYRKYCIIDWDGNTKIVGTQEYIEYKIKELE